MTTTPKKIMISSVMKGFEEVREEIARVIVKSKNVPIYAETNLGDKPSKEEIEKMVNDSDCYIGIFHDKWGWVPPKDNPKNRSVTALEFTLAKKLGKPTRILVSDLEKEQELQQFLDEIGDYYDGKFFHKYKSIPELTGTVGLTIEKLISEISPIKKTAGEIEKSILEYSNKFKDTIKDNIENIFVTPSELENLPNTVTKENCWIIGERGIGKSVILKKLIEMLLKEGRKVLFIRAEEILIKKDFQKVTNEDVGASLKEIIEEITKDDELFLVIDSIDAISRNSEAWSSFSAEIENIQKNPKIHTILSIRKSDYLAFEGQFSRNWGKEVVIEGFTEQQIFDVLEKLGIKDKIGKELFSILKHPFYLDILAALVKKGKISELSHLSNQYHFLKAHFDQVVRNAEKGSELAGKRVQLLYDIADRMSSIKRLKISNLSFPSTPEYDSLRSDGILVEDDYFVQFFHQVYFDFIKSLQILEQGKVTDFLKSIGNEIFLRSTIRCTLSLLRNNDESDYLKNLEELLTSNEIEFYWKMNALELVTSFREVSALELTALEGILKNDSELQGFFLKYALEQHNPIWYKHWKDSLFLEWSKDENFQSASILAQYYTFSDGVLKK